VAALLSDSGYWPLWFFTIVFILLDASFPIVWATVGDFFGRRHFATVRGSMSFFYMWGSVAGPVLAGAIYDQTESYMTVLWIWLGLLTFATFLVLFLIRPWIKRMMSINSPYAQ
jgi:MFS family permease